MSEHTQVPPPAVDHTDSLPAEADGVETGPLSVEQRFAVVPEWLLDSTVSDSAFRLYAVLARYGNTSGVRMPGRVLLAERLHRSLDTVDRALKELTAAGILSVERRTAAGRNLTNRYHLRTLDPAGEGRTDAATPAADVQVHEVGSRTDAATPGRRDAATPGRRDAATGGRTAAARVAAGVRPNPDVSTETPPPPTPAARQPGDGPRSGSTVRSGCRRPDPAAELLAACRVEDLLGLAGQVRQVRTDLGLTSVRWSAPCLAAALQFAVKVRGWPAQHARAALLLVAADPATRSPMRLAEAGPWWDHAQRPTLSRTAQEQAELDGLEATLVDRDDRAALQGEARRLLAAGGEPVTRLSVARRAARLAEQQTLANGRQRPPASVVAAVGGRISGATLPGSRVRSAVRCPTPGATTSETGTASR